MNDPVLNEIIITSSSSMRRQLSDLQLVIGISQCTAESAEFTAGNRTLPGEVDKPSGLSSLLGTELCQRKWIKILGAD